VQDAIKIPNTPTSDAVFITFMNVLLGTDKLTHTRGLELQNSCGDSIITDRWLHLERNFMQKEAEYSHF
jgi:hypothetical protein